MTPLATQSAPMVKRRLPLKLLLVRQLEVAVLFSNLKVQLCPLPVSLCADHVPPNSPNCEAAVALCEMV